MNKTPKNQQISLFDVINEKQDKTIITQETTPYSNEEFIEITVEFMFDETRVQIRALLNKATKEILCSAVDCCKALGYKNPANAWKDLSHRSPEVLQFAIRRRLRGNDEKLRESDCLTRKGMSVLAMLSKGSRAEAFRNWAAEVIEEKLNNENHALPTNTATRLPTHLETARNLVVALERLVEIEPMAEVAATLTNCSGTRSLSELAKILSDSEHGTPLGLQRLCEWLRHKKVFMKATEPYQPYIDKGWFTMREHLKLADKESELTTRVTMKGEVEITKMWIADHKKLLNAP